MDTFVFLYTEEELNIATEKRLQLKRHYRLTVMLFCFIEVAFVLINLFKLHVLAFVLSGVTAIAFGLFTVAFFDVKYAKIKKICKFLDNMQDANCRYVVAKFLGKEVGVDKKDFSFARYKFYDFVEEREVVYLVEETVDLDLSQDVKYDLKIADSFLIAYKEA